jgi:UDP-glucose 4-epimerase
MSALITGGAGFIGSHVAKMLLDGGHDVTIVDNLSSGFLENIPEKATLLKLDISDEKFVKRLKDVDADIVIHMAAQASGEGSFDNPAYDLRTNALGTLMLLDWAADHCVKFIFTSSMGVYGDSMAKLTEKSPAVPKSFYGVGKCASENYIRIFNDMGLDTTVLRLFNVYGPGQNMSNMKQGMVSIYMAYIGQGKPILVKGPLDRFRDFVYIDDVVRAVKMCIERAQSGGKTFNVCTGRKTTVKGLLDMIVESFGYEKGKYPITIGPRTPRDQDGAYGSYDYIYKTIGWEPTINLEAGVAIMTDWVKEYYKGYVA